MNQQGYKIWTTQENLQLESLVKDGSMSFKEIGKIMNRTPSSCQSHSKVLGLSNPFVNRTYSVNHDFWAKQNLINCYWAGFSAADGYIYEKSNTYKLELGSQDECHLIEFKNNICYSGNIKSYKSCPKTKMIVLNSKRWIEDLNNIFNISQNKTYRLEPPKFDLPEYELAWLIGYIDGDGCIHVHKRNNYLMICFVSSSEKMMKYINDFCDSKLGVGIKNKKRPYKKHSRYNCFIYSVSGVRAIKLYELLKDIKVPKLARKWDNPLIKDCIDKQKLKFPKYFQQPI